MKTTLTISVDADLKEKGMKIIQEDLRSNISREINLMLKKLIEKKEGRI